MKNLLPCFLFATLLSNNAFATHAYRSENCKSLTHELNYKGNYPVGGMYGLSKADQEEDTSALPLFDTSETPNTLEDADVIFSEISSEIIEVGPSTKDCGFDHEEWKSLKVVEINLISDDAIKNLGLDKGYKLTFICEETTDYPNGSECE